MRHTASNSVKSAPKRGTNPLYSQVYNMTKNHKIKKVRLHSEGNDILRKSLLVILVTGALLYYLLRDVTLWPFYAYMVICIILYAMAVNFFRCPIRIFNGDKEGAVLAAADGKVVVIEEVEENEYFHDRRLMISIFMSITNVHANWFPVEGLVKKVVHHKGNFHKAWLPKASTENERSTVVIETPDGKEVLVRQIAGAVARRIVTYAREDEDCYFDEHMGFIKFGSRVDVYLPTDTEVLVKMGQRTVGNQTVIAKLK